MMNDGVKIRLCLSSVMNDEVKIDECTNNSIEEVALSPRREEERGTTG